MYHFPLEMTEQDYHKTSKHVYAHTFRCHKKIAFKTKSKLKEKFNNFIGLQVKPHIEIMWLSEAKNLYFLTIRC